MPKFDIKVQNIKAEFNKLEQELKTEAATKSDLVILDAISDLRDATPKDSGFAADSWYFQKEGKDLLTGYENYSLTNSAPYIETLNNGSSRQAPKRFIEKTLFKYFESDGIVVKVIPIRN